MSSIATKPLHPSVASRLDPGYVEIYNSTIQYFPPLGTTPWNRAIREAEDEHEIRAPLDVAKVQDFDLTHAKIRTFTPHGPVPKGGWPVFIFMHGGGWTLGNIRIGTSFSTHVAEGAHCVVVSTLSKPSIGSYKTVHHHYT
ncbi:hypothetical protein H0H93_013881 [Arthromyces matolae]|nr:hypothetical protein H0H93_013881 [Arthromyces matolae]